MEMVLVFDDSGKILYANRSAKEALMYYDDLCGCPIAEIFPGEFTMQNGGMGYTCRMDGTFQSMMAYRRNKTCFPAKVKILTHEDESKVFEMPGQRFDDLPLYGGQRTYICMAYDISKEDFLEKKINNADKEVEAALKVKSEFIANVTHELRTPVNGILGNTMELLEKEDEKSKVKSDIKIAMTGTPVENRLTELWSIFDFINKGYLGSLKEFQKSYAVPIERFKEKARASKLKLSVSPFVLRRLKTDKNVISDLPEKMVMNDYCYLAKSQAILYEKTLNEMMEKISGFTGVNRRGNIFKLITALKQICNHPYQFLKSGEMGREMSGKMEKCIDLVQSILDNGEKTLIFTQYKEMGDILCKVIGQECNTEPLFFHGSLTVPQREELIERFQTSDDCKVMILSLKAGGTGLNLTSATNVIHYDLWWNPAVEDQATDRTYRIGQDKNVMVHRMITLGTFEEKIDEMLKSKKELADLAVYEGEKIITELSDEEIYEIFTLSA